MYPNELIKYLKNRMHYLVPMLTFMLLFSCVNNSSDPAYFHHDVVQGPTPWTHENFSSIRSQFTFAIISDLNGGEREGIFNVAVAQISLLRPEFILSVGDLIDGGTEDRNQLLKEWESFDERAARTPVPLFRVGGNHDLTNVIMREFWAERFGPRYYHFVYNNVLFLILDSEDYLEERMHEIYLARAAALEVLDGDEPEKAQEMLYFKMPERRTGEISDAQSAYFEEVLAKYPDVYWTFLFMHKPTWLREGDGGLSRIESALDERPYTVFNGHFHTYSYNERKGRDYIMLGTTGGGQNESEERSFDHITLVTITDQGPSIANLKLDGILNKAGEIPAGGEELCFQASRCATSD